MTVLVLDEDERMIAATAAAFFGDQSPIASFRALRDADRTGHDPEVWRGMVELGLSGLLIPEAEGGVGLSHMTAGLVCQAAGRTLARTPFLATAILGASAILLGANALRKAEALPKIASGEWVIAFATDEQSRHAPDNVASAASRDGDGFRLNGAKLFVLDGGVADRLVVSARLADGTEAEPGIALFLVNPALPGIALRSRSVVDASNVVDIAFTDVHLPGDALLCSGADGQNIRDRVLDIGRACLAAEALGIAEEVFERTVDYLKQREQFGVKIGSFQALQHRVADLFCQIQLARSTVLAALRSLDDANPRASWLASLAAAKVAMVGRLVTDAGVHLHGGIGMTDEFDIGLFMKRMGAIEATFGDYAFHLDRMARLDGY